MRLWYQSMTVLEDTGRYGATIAQAAKDIFGDGVELTVRGFEREAYHGHVPGEVFRYPILKEIIVRRSIMAAITAEREGFDGYVIGSYSEPFLKQTRAAVRIPVISIAESTLSTALSIADRFALVSLAPSYARRLEELVARHGLSTRFAGAYGLDDSYTERHASAALDDPTEFLDRFKDAARRAAASGADLVIPAEGILCQLIREARLRDVDGVMVMDSVGVCLRHAEMMVKLKWETGLEHARRFSYPVPPADMLAKFI